MGTVSTSVSSYLGQRPETVKRKASTRGPETETTAFFVFQSMIAFLSLYWMVTKG